MTEAEKLESFGVPRVLLTLKRYGSIRRAANVLKVTHVSLQRWLKRNNLEVPERSPELNKQFPNRRKKHSSVYRWLEKHPGTTLPRNTQGIIDITGCTKGQVKSWIARERAHIRSVVANIPSFENCPLELTAFKTDLGSDSLPYKIPAKEVTEVDYLLDKWSQTVYMECTYKGTRYGVAIKDIEDFAKSIFYSMEV